MATLRLLCYSVHRLQEKRATPRPDFFKILPDGAPPDGEGPHTTRRGRTPRSDRPCVEPFPARPPPRPGSDLRRSAVSPARHKADSPAPTVAAPHQGRSD